MNERALEGAGNTGWYQMFGPVSNTPIYNVKIHVPPKITLRGERVGSANARESHNVLGE
jgi:hypothetical protein